MSKYGVFPNCLGLVVETGGSSEGPAEPARGDREPALGARELAQGTRRRPPEPAFFAKNRRNFFSKTFKIL